MPLPFILGAAAAIAGIAGVGSGISGAVKMKEANDTMESANRHHKENIARFEKRSDSVNRTMDTLGTFELEILNSFEDFSDIIEKIQNRPRFEDYTKEGVTLPAYNKEELTSVSVGAGVLLGSLGGAALGTAGGIAAAGATTSAVMALGTASTGTAIVSLSGAAATNATLAAIGGGALAAGGGGIALGTTILGATTLGVGLLVGGIIFNTTGEKLSDEADEAYRQMKEAEKQINMICDYLSDLEETADRYYDTLDVINDKYQDLLNSLSCVVNEQNKTNWNLFTEQEKTLTQNTVLLVGLLYKMCQVQLVNQADDDDEMNTINRDEIKEAVVTARKVIKEL